MTQAVPKLVAAVCKDMTATETKLCSVSDKAMQRQKQSVAETLTGSACETGVHSIPAAA